VWLPRLRPFLLGSGRLQTVFASENVISRSGLGASEATEEL
jgi:hypothetical protein